MDPRHTAAAAPNWTPFQVLEHVNVEHRMSVVFSLLPASVQRNLPPMKSLRRSISNHSILRWRNGVVRSSTSSSSATAAAPEKRASLAVTIDDDDDDEDLDARSIDDGYFGTRHSSSAESTRPPTPFSSRPGTSAGSLTSFESATTIVESSTQVRSGGVAIAPLTELEPLDKRAMASGALVRLPPRSSAPQPVPAAQQQSGLCRVLGAIDQKLKSVGLSLLRLSDEEARRRDEADYDGQLERRTFLDGLAYLNRAIPDDLTEAEIRALRSALPAALLGPLDLCTPACAHGHGPRASCVDVYGGGGGDSALAITTLPPSGLPPDRQTVLYRSVRFLVVQVFLLAQLLLPRLILLARAAARTERKYRVSATLVGQGAGLAAALGRHGMQFGSAVARLDEDGRVGEALGGALAWTVEGLAGGFTDGVGEGLSVVAAQRKLGV